MNKPLSNIDLQNMIHDLDGSKLNFMRFDDINKNTKLEDIFKNRGHVILFQSSPNDDTGHWTALTRNKNNEYVFMDSYGRALNYFNKHIKENLSGTLYNNLKQYQSDSSAVCGRYSFLLVALNKLTNGINTQDAITELLKNKPKNLSCDEFVLELTK